MASEFAIHVDWVSDDFGPDELRHTSALITIAVNHRIVTRVEDEWSKTVRPEVRLPAYPLALWFASSWWRLEWEPPPPGPVTLSWRMAHEMAAAGQGLLWPPITFESDGEMLDISWHPTELSPAEPVRYLDNHHNTVPLGVFEDAIDAFVELTLARLDAMGIEGRELRSLWREVSEERRTEAAARYRQIEARLGFDPDDAREGAVNDLVSLAAKAGGDAVNEIATACAVSENPVGVLREIIHRTSASRIEARMQPTPELKRASARSGPMETAGARGFRLAHVARAAWGLESGPVTDQTLSELLSIQDEVLKNQSERSLAPVGLAIRNGRADKLELLFQRRSRTGRRFEASRFMADNLTAPPADHWLPATSARTARQKLQRAFAIELLAPIDDLVDHLGGDYSDEAFDEAGQYYGISPLAVQSHLANNGVIPRF